MSRILLACLLLWSLTACIEDFEEINTNPNSPVEVPPSYLITQAERNLVDLVLGEGFTGIGTFASHYVQHLSQKQYTDVTRYDDVPTSFYPFYTGGLQDLENVVQLNTDPATREVITLYGANENQIALARIMQSWTYLSMTDFWGDIPYSEALKGLDNLNPRYDTQETIYRGVVDSLVKFGDMIIPGGVEGDIIYGGNMDQWRKFANSIILRAGIRMSDVAPELGREWVNLALSRGVLEGNADNAQLEYITGGEFANNTFYTDAITRFDYAISLPLVNFLEARNDPRLMVYAQPTLASSTTDTLLYVGMPYGITQGEAGAIPTATVSRPGLAFTDADAPAVLLTYSEVLFNQAEAAARGWIDGDAEALYRAAITASMNQYGISNQAAIDAYLAQPNVVYNGTNVEQSIGEQKWVALYFQGMEAWSEWRRLNYPRLTPAPNAIRIKTIPTRRGYPDNEFSLNQANYLEALQRQFGTDEDPLDGRVWWDVD